MDVKIKVIIKRPDEETGHVTWISNNLKVLQKHVEGYIETVTVAPNMTIICNEEGRILGLPYNCRLCGIDFVGTIIIAGVDGENLTDVPISFDTYKKLLLEVE